MNKNEDSLKSFTRFCQENPDMRFWQALASWSGWHYVLVSDRDTLEDLPEDIHDTFYTS